MATGLTTLSFVIEKKEGLLDRSLTAGVSAFEILLAHVFTQLFVLIVQVTLVMVFALAVFEVSVHFVLHLLPLGMSKCISQILSMNIAYLLYYNKKKRHVFLLTFKVHNDISYTCSIFHWQYMFCLKSFGISWNLFPSVYLSFIFIFSHIVDPLNIFIMNIVFHTGLLIIMLSHTPFLSRCLTRAPWSG